MYNSNPNTAYLMFATTYHDASSQYASRVESRANYNRIDADRWYNLVITKKLTSNGFTTKMYLDAITPIAVSKIITDIPTTIPLGENILRIGAYPAIRSFDGAISDIIVADGAFTDEDISDYMNGLTGHSENMHSTVLIKQDYSIPALKGSSLTCVTIQKSLGKGEIYGCIKFDANTYYIFKTTWIPIVSNSPSIHGVVGNTNWHYRNSNGTFTQNTVNDEANCISSATAISSNQLSVDTMENWNYSTSLYDASTGVCDVACTISYSNTNKFESVVSISSVYFNRKKIKVLKPIDLSEYSGVINKSLIFWEYKIGNNLLDLSQKIKVYSRLSNASSWTQCTMNSAVPNITASMITTGLQLYLKVEVDIDSGIESEDIIVVTKLY
jgi:hypothetical protein